MSEGGTVGCVEVAVDQRAVVDQIRRVGIQHPNIVTFVSVAIGEVAVIEATFRQEVRPDHILSGVLWISVLDEWAVELFTLELSAIPYTFDQLC